MGINPIKLQGSWDEGYALDRHVIMSSMVGEDEYGHKQFDNTRSEIGELLYQFKYQNKYACLQEIMTLVLPFLANWPAMKTVSVVVPAPASNNRRQYQPAYEIAREVAKYLNSVNGFYVWYSDDVLQKKSTIQSKGLNPEQKQQIKGTVVKSKNAVRLVNLLIVDDLFQSGSTLEECAQVLRQDPNIGKIHVLTITKTKG